MKHLYVGAKVYHNFSKTKGRILDHRKDPKGYDWLVAFLSEDNEVISEDWYKTTVLENDQ